MPEAENSPLDLNKDPRAVVLEEKQKISIRRIEIDEELKEDDVRIAVHTVGICGSDIHYYLHGAIGPFVVKEPMVLGHEASGIVTEVGRRVRHLRVGDRVCMEPGIPNQLSEETWAGRYNIDPEVRFWATPPVHGVLRRSVVHPAALTFRLPQSVSFAEGAMVEPLAVCLHAMNKAKPDVGSVAVVIGAGTIGLLNVLTALAGGCSRVIVSDIDEQKLVVARRLGPVTGVNVTRENLSDVVLDETEGRGADVVFECSGDGAAAAGVIDVLGPGGTAVFVGMPAAAIAYDVTAAQAKEIRVEHVFRYANVFRHCIAMLASGRIDVKPLITRTFGFEGSVEAFELASTAHSGEIKVQIEIG